MEIDASSINSYIKGVEAHIDSDNYSGLRYDMSNESKTVFQRDIETVDNFIKIIPVGDVHYGHKTCNNEAFLRTIDHIKNTNGVYTVLVGDLFESATKSSVGAGPLEQDSHLNVQMTDLYDILKPLAEEGKILACVQGNHEERLYQFAAVELLGNLCHALHVPYQQYQMYMVLNINDVKYKLFMTHGKGGGTSKSSKINSIGKGAQIAPLMDLYISGHLHDDITDKTKVVYIDEDNILREHIRRYVMCGSFLNYYGSYAEQAVLPPGIIGAPQVILSAEYKNIQVLN